MLSITDPGNNYAIEVHQYLDSDSSGTGECLSASIGAERMVGFSAWLRLNHKRAFLGEFGASSNPTCLTALDKILTHLDQNADLYLGWTYWAAGPWWGDYFMSIEPLDGEDRPQMEPLSWHLW
jgi:endoglucanase